MGPPPVFEPFAALPAIARARIAQWSRLVHVPRGVELFAEGASAEAIYVLHEGRVQMQRCVHDGFRCIRCVIRPGEMFCCLPALDGGPYPATAVAPIDSVVQRVPAALFREPLGHCTSYLHAVLTHVGGRLRENECARVPCGDCGSRLADRILSMSEKFGPDVPLTRRELGELAGTTVETAIREIKKFERAGWVQLRRGHVRVLAFEALRNRTSHRSAP